MSYTDPPDFTAADVLAADELDILSEDIRDLDSRVSGVVASIVQLQRSAAQAIATGVGEYIVWSAENMDIGGWYSGSGDTIIVPASAIPDGSTSIVVVASQMQSTFEADSVGIRRVRLHVNGSSVGGSGDVPAISASDGTVVFCTEAAEVEALDEIQFEVYQNSGGPLNVTASKITLFRHGVAS